MKKVIFFINLLALVACTNSQKMVPDNSKTAAPSKNSEVVIEGCKESISMAKGQRLVLKLPATAGTGYIWKTESVSRNLTQNNTDNMAFEPMKKEDAEKVGYPSWQKLEFSAVETGDAVLILNYLRPWDAKTVGQTCKMRVQIQ